MEQSELLGDAQQDHGCSELYKNLSAKQLVGLLLKMKINCSDFAPRDSEGVTRRFYLYFMTSATCFRSFLGSFEVLMQNQCYTCTTQSTVQNARIDPILDLTLSLEMLVTKGMSYE